MAEQWAERLGGAPLAFVHKSRDLTVPNQAVSKTVVGQIEGRTCVLIDDMIDTGGTISGAVQVLKNAGAKDVIIAATHAVFSDPAARRLSESGAREVVVTNTLPITADKRFPQLTVLSIAPLIARAIREVFDDGSVTSLFDGQRLDPPSAWPTRRRSAPGPFSETGPSAGSLVPKPWRGRAPAFRIESVLTGSTGLLVSVIDWV